MKHYPTIADDTVLAGLDPKYLWMRNYLRSLNPQGLASKKDVDPTVFPEHMPFVNLVDVLHDDEIRFKFRLVGGEQNRRAGRFIAGQYIEDAVMPDFVDRIRTNMVTAVETGQPIYDRFPMPHPDKSFVDSERVYFPLAKDGRKVDTLLILNGYNDIPAAAGSVATNVR
ncbi:hypothetical protein EOI86_17465 [Hwanghaeella grinnelliae]|uniref:PAS domain-containing protein n=1 Tax=Hwanghaeella grinnelliae TaxID=2500179 RepID=A0A437QJG4_9PROT|nr:hypothetical protein [Hwanghaeella grinnelliae]RVU34646.1 hypothetical protein EOI86_17465 [Hwanghaeella grinnelliae]